MEGAAKPATGVQKSKNTHAQRTGVFITDVFRMGQYPKIPMPISFKKRAWVYAVKLFGNFRFGTTSAGNRQNT
jgi:hypothetical protein